MSRPFLIETVTRKSNFMPYQIEKEAIINRPRNLIYDYLAKASNYRQLQPFVVNISNIQETRQDDGTICYDYRAIEQLRILGIFSFQIKIPVHMILKRINEEIINQTEAAFNIRLTQTLTLTEISADETRVVNKIEYEAPSLLRSYVHKQIDHAHGNLVQNLKVIMEQANV